MYCSSYSLNEKDGSVIAFSNDLEFLEEFQESFKFMGVDTYIEVIEGEELYCD